MRETNFIKQNKEKWKEFEAILKANKKDPNKLSDLFVQITDDLSYSRTYYANRSVRVYLNGIAQRIFYSIYKNKRSRISQFIRFWKEELPQLVYESRKEFLLAFLVFAVSVMIGIVSTHMNPDFASLILGEDYVEQTIENIENGEPMAVYNGGDEGEMALRITVNNLRVAFYAFMFGLFFSLGTYFILVKNGIMVGAFQYFFYVHGVFWDSFLTIWLHGTLEISAIIISGAAGLVLGKGLIFPGTYTRMQALQLSARRGIKIMLGIAPIIILAGFIEGFITRHTEVSYFWRAGLILSSLAFILGYFGYYTMLKAKKGYVSNLKEAKLPPTPALELNLKRLRNSGNIFSDVFVLYRRHIGLLLTSGVVLSIAFTAAITVYHMVSGNELFDFQQIMFEDYFRSLDDGRNFPPIKAAQNSFQFFNFDNVLDFRYIFNVIFIGAIVLSCGIALQREAKPDFKQNASYWINAVLAAFAGTAVLIYLMGVLKAWNIFTLPILLPFIALWVSINFVEKTNIIASVGRSLSVFRSGFGLASGVQMMLILMSLGLLILVGSAVLSLFRDVIVMNLFADEETLYFVNKLFFTFAYCFAILMIFPLLIMGGALTYFTLKEVQSAEGLMSKIAALGVKKKKYGLEQEQ